MSARNQWRIVVCVVLLGILVLTAACAASDSAPPDEDADRGGEETMVLGAGDDGSQVELTAGQVLEVTLESNPTTGYSWEVTEVDGAVLAQVGEAEFQEAPKGDEEMVGVGGTETFRFEASAGETTLTLVYHRSWEEDVEPLEIFTVDVVVR